MSYVVVDAPILQCLGVRPHLDKLGVPRQLADWEAGARTDEVDDGSNRCTETVGDVALRPERLTLDLQIS